MYSRQEGSRLSSSSTLFNAQLDVGTGEAQQAFLSEPCAEPLSGEPEKK